MRLGLGFLRLAPAVFWRMTPRELACALDSLPRREAAPGRETLAALMRAFPDNQN